MKALKDTIFEKLSVNDINIKKQYGKFVNWKETCDIIDNIRDNTKIKRDRYNHKMVV